MIYRVKELIILWLDMVNLYIYLVEEERINKYSKILSDLIIVKEYGKI